jgi:hypothetical protein
MNTERPTSDVKATLHRYLKLEREALVEKVDGLTERQARWPMTPTGTNLLGLLKHLAFVEFGYFGDTFGRPHGEVMPDFDADPNADFTVGLDESLQDIVALYRRAWAHSDATIEALDLDSPGTVPWWRPGSQDVQLERILVHVTTETARHAGHADIVRELTDGETGLFGTGNNIPEETDWVAHVARLRDLADHFA